MMMMTMSDIISIYSPQQIHYYAKFGCFNGVSTRGHGRPQAWARGACALPWKS